MEWLNYHHLLYFRAVAREGGVTEAARRLNVTAPTVSAQIRQLEEQAGDALFVPPGASAGSDRSGPDRAPLRGRDPRLGEELKAAVRRESGAPVGRLHIGLSMVVPKLIAHRLLQPARALDQPADVVCIEDKPERLIADLATYALDLVLTDAPRGSEVAVRAYNHLLGECGVSFYAAPKLAARLRRRFPRSLDGEPMLLPHRHLGRARPARSLVRDQEIRPRVVGEFDDSALMKVFGASGGGVFPSPSAIDREVRAQYRVQRVGRTDAVRERFYAISVERRLRHPAVVAISEGAREDLFWTRAAEGGGAQAFGGESRLQQPPSPDRRDGGGQHGARQAAHARYDRDRREGSRDLEVRPGLRCELK